MKETPSWQLKGRYAILDIETAPPQTFKSQDERYVVCDTFWRITKSALKYVDIITFHKRSPNNHLIEETQTPYEDSNGNVHIEITTKDLGLIVFEIFDIDEALKQCKQLNH